MYAICDHAAPLDQYIRSLTNMQKCKFIAVVGAYVRLELSDSNCILFSTELSSKNRFNILFGGFSWQKLAHSEFL